MTIDEAIESLKFDYEIDMYIHDIAPQLAEWLEELKEYKATNYPKCSECAGCTQWKCDCANVREKVIDDVVEKLEDESHIEPVDDMDPFGDIPVKVVRLDKAIEIVKECGASE